MYGFFKVMSYIYFTIGPTRIENQDQVTLLLQQTNKHLNVPQEKELYFSSSMLVIIISNFY